MAQGNTHNQNNIDNTYGIKLMQGGNAFAEIEDQETIKDGEKVYSDKLKSSNGLTYAENAEKLSKKKGKLEKNFRKRRCFK